MRVAAIALSLLFALSGCGNGPFIPQEVSIPIFQRCEVTPPVKPDFHLPQTKVDATLVDKVKAALADIELYKGYTGELEAAVDACHS